LKTDSVYTGHQPQQNSIEKIMKNQNPGKSQSPMNEKSVKQNVDQELEHLRLQLDAIDQQIVSLLSKRQDEVERVVQLKKAHNLPVYHPAREENLISHCRNQGSKAGLDPDYVEEIYRRILRQSRAEQTAQMAQKGIRAGASILLIGGLGSMGQYFHQWFANAGYQIRILDQKDWPDVDRLCQGIELAIIQCSHRGYRFSSQKNRPLSTRRLCFSRYHQRKRNPFECHA